MVVGCKQPSRSRKLHHCRYDQSLESSFPTSTKLTNNTLSHLQPRKEKPPNLTSTTKINNTPYGLQSPRHEPERTSPIQLHRCATLPNKTPQLSTSPSLLCGQQGSVVSTPTHTPTSQQQKPNNKNRQPHRSSSHPSTSEACTAKPSANEEQRYSYAQDVLPLNRRYVSLATRGRCARCMIAIAVEPARLKLWCRGQGAFAVLVQGFAESVVLSDGPEAGVSVREVVEIERFVG